MHCPRLLADYDNVRIAANYSACQSMRKKTFIAFQFHSPPLPHCILIFCCWHLHIDCIKSSHIRVLKSITLHQFSGELAAVVMCGTAVLCVQLSWYGLSHLTWQSQANVLHHEMRPSTPSSCQSAVPPSFPLIILCSFEIINMQGWHGLYSGFRQSTAVSACLLKHFIYHLPYRCEVEP